MIVSTSAKTPNASSWSGHRVEEDDLDVEQDEEHRDQVEADPEAEVLLDLGGQAALVGLALDLVWRLGPEHAVGECEGGADADAQGEEDEGWQIGLQHRRRRYNRLCATLLHSAKGLYVEPTLHMWLGVAVLAANGVAGAWGAVAWLRGEPSVVFWYLLRVAQAAVVVQVVLGLLLLARGDSRRTGCTSPTGSPARGHPRQRGLMRVGAAQRELEAVGDVDALERREQIAARPAGGAREMGVMTIGALLIVTLALRAMQSGG